ncbi:Stonustoxin subunit alpha [Labeo rohita]|uniref:Stonustoxin subunit alpha n=1 Tax=Labeo rohita TaxID=84645 RepID=A0ABQ8LPH1_LABRO|nr:Stonustoxin subunit alpha [Labeo rohita]
MCRLTDSSVELLSAGLSNTKCKLEILSVEGLEEQRDMETLRQYKCQLTWDPNTASSSVQVSEKDETHLKDCINPETVPHHPERFKSVDQIMSREGQSSRHFFQLEWFGSALHGGVEMQLPDCSPCRVGVYLDWGAGTLSFYNTINDEAKLIHTFHAKFTQPLFLLVSVSVGVKILPDVPPPICAHDHDPWGGNVIRHITQSKGQQHLQELVLAD